MSLRHLFCEASSEAAVYKPLWGISALPGVYVVDDWDFGTGAKFDTSSLMGIVRQAEENYGSQENDSLSPIRSIKAFKYKL